MDTFLSTDASPSLSAPLVTWVAEQINNQSLVPGDKLPSEKQLCEQFGVSRPVVREGLSQLKSEGLVVSHKGKGVFVSERGSRQSFRLPYTELHDAEGLAHTLELIQVFERSAARYAAMRRTPDDLKRIRRALIAMEYAILSDLPGDEEDYAFHQAIVDATHNPHFIQLNEYLEQHARRFIRQARQHTVTYHHNLIQTVQQEHQEILQAIEEQDPDAAATAAETHLQNAAQRLHVYLKKG
ncbi:FadR/GntR family transcriptional regulator [Paenalcaligenes sp. Me131]|uniref:FadR/GntR family transcriptional regulator n=1 Tax=Paenalcaligenes sp. Me131 TaxID=3392636 RepID=UPI003D2BD320